jgi:hypothetical protein
MAGFLAVLLALTLAPLPALAGFQMTKAQYDEITSLASDVEKALEAGGVSKEESKVAGKVIQASLIASYSKGRTNAEANQAAAPVLDAFMVQPGASQRELTDAEYREVETSKAVIRDLIKDGLRPDTFDAAMVTAEKAMTKNLRAGEGRQSDIDGVRETAAQVTRPFFFLPPVTDPESPFHTDPPVFAESPAPRHSASSAPPPPADPLLNADPDSITATSDDGRVIVGKPDGEGGTGMTVTEFTPETGGDANNRGNSSTRTGSDNGKKDEKPKPSSSSSSSSGGGHHK